MKVRGGKRRGSIALLGLVGLMFLSVVFLALVNYCWVWLMRVQIQNAADAASLATVQAFANDALLAGIEPGLSENFAKARDVGVEYAAWNPSLGQPTPLDPNYGNLVPGELVLGALDIPAKMITPEESAATNAARVLLEHVADARGPVVTILGGTGILPYAGVVVASTAYLDHQVIGFRPLGSNPIPVGPIALPATGSDPFQGATTDDLRFHPSRGTFVSGSDGLPEVSFTISLAPVGGQAAAYQTGLRNPADVLRTGTLATDLKSLGGELRLDSQNRLQLPAAYPMTRENLLRLRTAFDEVADGRQVAFAVLDSAGVGDIVVKGWVAARVVRTVPVNDDSFIFVLQPTLMVQGSALTDASRAGVNGGLVPTPTVGKVRLVE